MNHRDEKSYRYLFDKALHGIASYPATAEPKVTIEPISESEQVWKALIRKNLLERGAKQLHTWIKPLPPVSEADSLTSVSGEIGAIFQIWASQNQWALCQEILNLLISTNKTLPPSSLPFILSHFRSQPKIWPYLIRAGGNRLNWLSKYRPGWKWWQLISEVRAQSDLPEEFLVETFVRIRQINPKAAAQALTEKWPNLSLALKREIFEIIQQNPKKWDVTFITSFLNARKKKDRVDAILSLIRIEDTPVFVSLHQFCKSYLDRSLFYSSGSIRFKANYPSLTGLAFSMEALLDHDKALKNPVYKLLELANPDIWLEKWPDSVDTYVTQLIQAAPPELVGALVKSASRFQHHELMKSFLDQWNTGEIDKINGIDMMPLLSKLPNRDYNICIRDILSKDPDPIKRLVPLCLKNPHYISRENSDTLAMLIIKIVRSEINYSDQKMLPNWIDNLSIRLDPRCYPTLRKYWPDDHLFYPSMIKTSTRLRNILEKRFRSFQLIVEE